VNLKGGNVGGAGPWFYFLLRINAKPRPSTKIVAGSGITWWVSGTSIQQSTFGPFMFCAMSKFGGQPTPL
jgi:hypothetical protein